MAERNAGAVGLGLLDFQLSTIYCQLLPRDPFLRNEAKKLLKTKDRAWNKPKRTQETTRIFSYLIDNTMDIRPMSEAKACLSY